MSSQTGTHDGIDLPSFPGARSLSCPFDPPAEYTQWRLDEGLSRVRTSHGKTAWAVSRYEDVKAALGDPRISADVRRYPVLMVSAEDLSMPPVFPRQDDPEHARIRRMLTGEFTVKRMEAMRPRLRDMIDRILEEMLSEGRQPIDLVHAYALPVPSLAISLMLGVPYENHGFFQERSSALACVDTPEDERRAARRELFDFIVDLVRHKESDPGDDLISRLLANRVATGELTHAEVAMIAQILLHAGHETTANMIGLGVVALLRHPDQAARIRDTDDPVAIAGAVDEFLRYLSIAQDMVWRVATEDLTLGGQLVCAGDMLAINLPSANRDPFFQDPDDLDIGRNARGHLAFGHGVHQCLGQSLARVELQEAFPALLRALPDLRLAVPLEEIRYRHEMATFGVHELPVTW